MATQTTGGGSTTSFTNTPQANPDVYNYIEDELRANALLYNISTQTTFLDVMSNDLGGKAKTLFSIDDGQGALNELLQSNVTTGWEQTTDGNWIRINAGKIEFRIGNGTDNSSDVRDVNSLGDGDSIDDTFTYAIRMGNGTLAHSTVRITITGENDDATISGDNDGELSEDGVPNSTSGTLVVSDVDADENELQPVPAGTAGDNGYGTFEVLANGQWTYTLDNSNPAVQALAQGAIVYDMITVTSEDGTDTELITIKITGTNDGPVANPDSDTTSENATLLVDVLANDTDVDDGAVLTVTLASAPAGQGTASVVANQVQFDPGSDFDYLNVGDSVTVTVSYDIEDEHGAPSSSTVDILVTGTNDGPVANPDSDTTSENATLLVDVLANDTDVDDGAVLSVTAASAPAGQGTASVVANQVQFDPGSDFDYLNVGDSVTVTVSYDIEDEHGAPSSSTVDILVTGTNDGPVANPDSDTTSENATLLVDVLANDTDVDDGAVLSVTAASAPAGQGTASVVANQVQFDPGSDFDYLNVGDSVTVTVSYDIEDEHGAPSSSTVDILVTGTNDGPVANPDSDTTSENATLLVDVLANDTDVDDGAVLSVTAASAPAGQGTASVVANQVQFDPGSDFDYLNVGDSVTVTVSYDIEDEHGAPSSSTVDILVTGTNDGPVANPDSDTTSENATLLVDVLANDTDVDDGAVLSVTAASAPAGQGTASVVANQVQFDPGSDFDYLNVGDSVTVTVSYDIEDEHGAPSSSTVDILVTGTNDGPVANPDSDTTSENATLLVDVLANDTDVDDGAVLSVTAASAPAGQGTASVVANQVQFDPGSDFDYLNVGDSVTVTVSYDIEDEHGAPSSSTVDILVTGTNDGPVANPDSDTTSENATLLVDVLANDTDVDDGAVLSVTAASAPAGQGTASVVANQVQFDPGSDFDYLNVGDSVTVTVSYDIEDEHGAPSSSTVDILVTGTNDGPVANPDSDTTSENATLLVDVLANDTDVDDGAVLSVTAASAPAGQGTASVVANQVQFDPGSDFDYLNVGDSVTVTVSYDIEDEHGAPSSSTVDILVTGTNDGPVAVDDTGAGNEDTLIGGSVANDTDADDGAVLSYAVNGVPPAGFSMNAAGTWTLDASNAAYQHLAVGATTDVIVGYTVTDEHGASDIGELKITVTGVNDAPALTGTQATLAGGTEDTAYIVSAASLLAGFTDVDDGAVLAVFGLSANHGSVVYNGDGTYTVTPDANYNGTVTLSYSVIDGNGGSVPASLSFNLAAVNDPAVISGDFSGSVIEATPANAGDPDDTGTVFAADVDNPPNTFVAVASTATASGYGSYAVSAAGVWTYTLNNANAAVNALATGFFLIDTFDVTAADGTTQTISVTINGATDAIVQPPTENGADPNDFDTIGPAAGATVTSNTVSGTEFWNGTNGIDTINAGNGTDTVYGHNGDDIINGQNGTDISLYGQVGNDTITGGNGGDQIFGGSGADTIYGNEAPASNEGGDAADTIYGGSGNDTIYGQGSSDNIIGGYGADTLSGGGGNDTFRYLSILDTNDIIIDFMNGDDQIDVSAIDAIPGGANDAFGWGGNTATANALWFEISGANTILFGDTDGNVGTAEFMITLQNFSGFGPYSNPLNMPPDITF